MTRMFPFLTSQPNPIGGCASGNYWGDKGFRLCSFDCSYCWAKDLKTRYKFPKYQGPWRIYPNAMKIHASDEFPWACDMIDIGDPTIPFREVLFELFRWIGSQPCPVLLLTKNPMIYRKRSDYIPENAILGATIESDDPARLLKISKAPSPLRRLDDMLAVANILPKNKRFISIEPIVMFTNRFIDRIQKIEPWAVAIGYDNYNNGLEEPPLYYTKELTADMQEFTTIYMKTFREANHSSLQGETK